ncbi:hypothetical protein HEP84_40520 [Streptomyces sp. RLB1-33]|uniref:hypothetical protein n=1 Tax=Streptomyces mirabilis TaxID=68239 RepID=UPI002001E210|nr:MULTISPECIES: hypothetical protein [Streptomyces]
MTRVPLLILPILDGGHELTIRKLKLQDDSFTIHYSITPPLPDADSAAPPFLPFLEAKDDLGNEYLDWGGAYGLSPDGIRTEGSLTGQPAPASEAQVLLVRVTFVQDSRETAYDMTLRIRP